MSSKAYLAVTVVQLIVGLFLIAGWVLNIIKIVAWNEEMGMLVVRIIGAFIAPLGAILGWF